MTPDDVPRPWSYAAVGVAAGAVVRRRGHRVHARFPVRRHGMPVESAAVVAGEQFGELVVCGTEQAERLVRGPLAAGAGVPGNQRNVGQGDRWSLHDVSWVTPNDWVRTL